VTEPPDVLHRAMVASYLLLVAGLGTNVVLGELRREFDLRDSVASLHGSFFGWSLLCLGLAAPIVARWSRTALMWTAITSLTLGPVIVATGHSPVQTLLGAAIAGLGAGLVVMTVPGLSSDHHGPNSGRQFARINAWAAGVGIGFSITVGACITFGLGWRWPLAIVPLALGLITAGVFTSASVPPDTDPPAGHPLLLLKDSGARSAWTTIVLCGACELTAAVWAVPMLRDLGGASSGGAAALGSVFAAGIMIGRFATERHQTFIVMCLGWIIAAAGGMLAWLGPGLPGRVAGLFLIGFGVAPLYPAAIQLLMSRPGGARQLSAAASVASGIAITFGPLALGVVADIAGFTTAPLVIPALAVVGLGHTLLSSDRTNAGSSHLEDESRSTEGFQSAEY